MISQTMKLLYAFCFGVLLFSCAGHSSHTADAKDVFLKNEELLSSVVSNILISKWNMVQANQKLEGSGILVNYIDVDNNEVLFFVDGFVDNCIGIGYCSNSGKGLLCGGHTSWDECIRGNWYKISST